MLRGQVIRIGAVAAALVAVAAAGLHLKGSATTASDKHPTPTRIAAVPEKPALPVIAATPAAAPSPGPSPVTSAPSPTVGKPTRVVLASPFGGLPPPARPDSTPVNPPVIAAAPTFDAVAANPAVSPTVPLASAAQAYASDGVDRTPVTLPAKPMRTASVAQAATRGLSPDDVASAPTSGALDLNSATADAINGATGRHFGRAIVRGRPYKSVDDLLKRRVLTRSDFDRLRKFVVVR